MSKKIVVRNSSDNIISEISSVISCDVSDRLCGEKTLSFETLMLNGLEAMREDEKYTVEFENDIYDVVSFEKKMSSSLYYIKLDCEHVSYRLNDTELEMFSRTGTCGEILIELLKGTGFIVKKAPGHTMTYSKQQSASVRAVLLDFAAINGCDVVFERFNVSVIPHRGEIKDTKIIDRNVLEISKSINVSDRSVAYSLKVRPKCNIGVGDEVHLVFDRLGIDDKVRVLGIQRQPFSSNDFTLEVGSYAPSVEAESAQIVTNMVSHEKSYYGARISADNGIEVNRLDGNARMVLNADKMAFYQGNDEVLYFDPVARKWKLSSEVEVHVSDSSGTDSTISALADSLTSRIQDADNHYIEIKQTIDGFTVTTEEGQTLIDGGMIVTDNIQLQRLIAKNSPASYVEMMPNGLNFVLDNANTIGIGYASSEIPLPYMIFGEGASPESDESGMIKFYNNGLWIGDSADRHSNKIMGGTGLFIDVPNDKIYLYIKGVSSQVSSITDLETQINALREEIKTYIPVAVFG